MLHTSSCIAITSYLPYMTHFWPLHNYIHIQLFYDNQSSATVVQEAKLERYINEHVNLLQRRRDEKRLTESVICSIGNLSLKLSVWSA